MEKANSFRKVLGSFIVPSRRLSAQILIGILTWPENGRFGLSYVGFPASKKTRTFMNRSQITIILGFPTFSALFLE